MAEFLLGMDSRLWPPKTFTGLQKIQIYTNIFVLLYWVVVLMLGGCKN